MHYFKARKYSVGMLYLDKAVEINPMGYLSYRAFIKCIFSKDYSAAIKDFDAIKALEGNSIVMDHSYDFYTALSYLQLNELNNAEMLFRNDIAAQEEEWGKDEYHFLSMFYYAVTIYEQEKWEESIEAFNKTLEKYPNFSEAHYYKSVSLTNLNKFDEAKEAYRLAQENGKKGNTISEDNSLYELYPYQVRWD
jgi:tetratricopeptide (TPR) repeat protein